MSVRRSLQFGRLAGQASRYFKDPKVPLWRKLLGAGAIAYVILPFDAIPDVIPVLGWLDDVGVLSVAAAVVVREVRKHATRTEPN